MSPRRRSLTPPERRPILAPWSKSDCPECGDPVEYVVCDVYDEGGTRARVERTHGRGTIAARMIGNQMHGYTITELRPLKDGFVRMRLHTEVCEFAVPPAEQHPLF